MTRDAFETIFRTVGKWGRRRRCRRPLFRPVPSRPPRAGRPHPSWSAQADHDETGSPPPSPPPSCPDLFRASTRVRRLARPRLATRCRKTWMPGTSPGMTEERTKRRGSRARPCGGHDRDATAVVTEAVVTRRARTVGICRRKCRPAGRVGKCRHSRSAFAGRECRPGSDLSTRCLCRRQAPDRDTDRGPTVRVALAPPSCPDLFHCCPV